MVMNIPLSEEGADMLYDSINREYKVHAINISIYDSHIQIIICDGMEYDNISMMKKMGGITITQSGLVLMCANTDSAVCALEIMKLILELIIKLEED